MAKIARITNFTTFFIYKEKRSRMASVSPQILQKSLKEQEFFMPCEKIEQQIWQKKARKTNFTNPTLRKRKGQVGLRDIRKFRKSQKVTRIFLPM